MCRHSDKKLIIKIIFVFFIGNTNMNMNKEEEMSEYNDVYLHQDDEIVIEGDTSESDIDESDDDS